MREITGPPKAIAYDSVGEPTRAAMSFADKQGMPVSKLSIIQTPKGEYLAAKQEVAGKPAAQILSGVLPQVIQEISGLDEAELDQPVLKPHPVAKTKLWALLWCAQHEMLHAGQIGLLRRQLGYAPL